MTTFSLTREQWEKIVEEQYRLFVTQQTARKSGNLQVMQGRILKEKMSRKSLMSTAVLKTDDIRGTMAQMTSQKAINMAATKIL